MELSTILEINKTLDREKFFRSVIEWNQGSAPEQGKIEGLEWNGKIPAKFEYNNYSLNFDEYRDGKIAAAQYIKKDKSGSEWIAEFIMNFKEWKMAVRLCQSYSDFMPETGIQFSSLYYFKTLIDRSYLSEDYGLPMSYKPIFIKEKNKNIMEDILNGTAKYMHPVVYVLKSSRGQDPVNIWDLSYQLKGLAHVLVGENPQINRKIENLQTGDGYDDAVEVYYPQAAFETKIFRWDRNCYNNKKRIEEAVMQAVQKYGIQRRVDKLYTWIGVKEAIANVRAKGKKEKTQTAENEKKVSDAQRESAQEEFGPEIDDLNEDIQTLIHDNKALDDQNFKLREDLQQAEKDETILQIGGIDASYAGEINKILANALQNVLPSYESQPRRRDILQDIIESNCE